MQPAEMFEWQGFVTRMSICAIGSIVGVPLVLFFWVLFLYENPGDIQPSYFFRTCAFAGLLGAFLLFIGGIVGANRKRWIALLPGASLLLISICALAASADWQGTGQDFNYVTGDRWLYELFLCVLVVMALLSLMYICGLKMVQNDPVDDHSNSAEYVDLDDQSYHDNMLRSIDNNIPNV
jgi:hypothetical protein